MSTVCVSLSVTWRPKSSVPVTFASLGSGSGSSTVTTWSRPDVAITGATRNRARGVRGLGRPQLRFLAGLECPVRVRVPVDEEGRAVQVARVVRDDDLSVLVAQLLNDPKRSHVARVDERR